MITISQYFGKWKDHPDVTPTIQTNALRLLAAVEKLQAMAIKDGVRFRENQVTHSEVSGTLYGGFRPKDCEVGAARSNHKLALAVDFYDPFGDIDHWCLTHTGKLEEANIWIEHPEATSGWSHWQCVPPKSGARIFKP